MLVAFVLAILLLGIDRLRQDVLYKENDVNASDTASVAVDPGTLLGIGQVLGGRLLSELIEFPTDPMTDPVEIPVTTLTGDLAGRHVKLRGVTAVFPSITLASWASIFTGELPGKTGQLGNEFFARDLLTQPGVPAGFGNPSGVVSYSSGSFPGYDAVPGGLALLPFEFLPFGSVEAGADPMIAPQNRLLHRPPGTVYEWFSETGRGKTVVVGNHYSRGADLWLTQDVWSGFTSLLGRQRGTDGKGGKGGRN